MKNKFLILWMLSSVLLSACDEELTPYNVDTCWLGFDMENSADTLVYRTFIYSGPQAETDTVWIPLKTIGKVVDYDRPVKLVQLPVEDSCAVAANISWLLMMRLCIPVTLSLRGRREANFPWY